MEFSKEQLSTLSNSFARDKMQKASQQPRSKRPRIIKYTYEKADIANVISENTKIDKPTKKVLLNNIENVKLVKLYTYIFGKKVYISQADMPYYKDFDIYMEEL